jgi:hypothetical protein
VQPGAGTAVRDGRPARVQAMSVLGNRTGLCVRGPTAPQNPCILTAEFALDGGA